MINSKSKSDRQKPKPNAKDVNEITKEDLTAKLETLRIKIALKKRNDKAILEELLETKAGAQKNIHSLIEENDNLRNEKNVAVNDDKTAGTKALLSEPKLLLEFRNKNPEEILLLLDDKIFDSSKKLDLAHFRLKNIQGKLSKFEKTVNEWEQTPPTGSSLWEDNAIDKMMEFCVRIDDQNTFRDASKIVNSKFKEILQELKNESHASWKMEIQELEIKLDDSNNEFLETTEISQDAFQLRDSASQRYKMLSREFRKNKNARKRESGFMKKQLEKAYKERMHRLGTDSMTLKELALEDLEQHQKITPKISLEEILKHKQAQVLSYEVKTRTLVEAMRVPDLSHCLGRLSKLWTVKKGLIEASEMKSNMKNIFIRQKSNLTLISHHYKSTGDQIDEIFESEIQIRKAEIAKVERKKESLYAKLNKLGEFTKEWHLVCIGIDDTLNLGESKSPHPPVEDIKVIIGAIHTKLIEIIKGNEDLRNQMGDSKQLFNYEAYVQVPRTRNSNRQSELENKQSELH